VGEVITVEQARHALVVRRPGADDDAVELAESLPKERYRTPVVVGGSALDAVARLDPWVVADIADAAPGGLRLVAPFLGAMGPDGNLPPARRLADRLRVEVVAADGTPVALADGSLFVIERGAGWVSYRPGRPRRRTGPRHPSPWWQEGLPAERDEQVTQIPAGLWVRRPGAPARLNDPLYVSVPDRDRMYIVLGAPGEEPPAAEFVAGLLRDLPDEERDRAVLAGYGGTDVAEAVADVLGAPVRVSHGVPSGMPGSSRPVFVDATGVATWRPFAVESVCRPGAPPLLDRWVAPVSTLGMVEPASYRLTEGWRVDVLGRGLLVRPDGMTPDPAWTTGTGATSDLVLAASTSVPSPVLAALNDVLRDLPADARDHLRVVPVTAQAAAAATGLDVAADLITPFQVGGRLELGAGQVILGSPADAEPPAGAVVVSADGRVLPAEPILAILPAGPAPTGSVPAGVAGPVPDQNLALPSLTSGAALPSVAASTVVPVVLAATDEQATAAPVSTAAEDGAGDRPVADVATVVPVPNPAPPATPMPAPPTTAVAPPMTPGPSASPVAAELSTSDTALSTSDTALSTSDTAPSASDTVVPAAQAPIEVPADATSTAQQRQAVRGRLGSRYDVATRAVTRLLSERPGLRAGPGERIALLAELAVVRMFAEDPGERHDTDFYVCLAGGLRRLPTSRAVVVRGIPADVHFQEDAVLRLRTPVVAAPATGIGSLGPAEVLIWTAAARRIDGLLTGHPNCDDRSGEVALPAHTRLRVLAIEPGAVRRVLLAEDGTPKAAALARLRAAAAARADVRDAGTPVDRWFGPLPAA
jgi:hypothetical protein